MDQTIFAQIFALSTSRVTCCSPRGLCSNIRCFRVDPSPSAPCVNERHGAPAVWSHGYTEASGVKNKSVLFVIYSVFANLSK